MMTYMITRLRAWRRGVRLYIAIMIGLLTLEVAWWAQTAYGGSSLMSIRVTQVYAWLALGLLGVTMLVGPLYKVFPQLCGRALMRDARRMIGIGAAWFAGWHAAIAYFILFKAPNPFHVPGTYQLTFSIGLLTLIVLMVLALTSFDKAFRSMGAWWFRLHRTVYAASALGLLHAFMIGDHATDWPALIILSLSVLLIFGLHTFSYVVHPQRPLLRLLSIGLGLIVMVAVFSYGYSQRLGHNPIDAPRSHQK